jgi:hypothetical protein
LPPFNLDVLPHHHAIPHGLAEKKTRRQPTIAEKRAIKTCQYGRILLTD